MLQLETFHHGNHLTNSITLDEARCLRTQERKWRVYDSSNSSELHQSICHSMAIEHSLQCNWIADIHTHTLFTYFASSRSVSKSMCGCQHYERMYQNFPVYSSFIIGGSSSSPSNVLTNGIVSHFQMLLITTITVSSNDQHTTTAIAIKTKTVAKQNSIKIHTNRHSASNTAECVYLCICHCCIVLLFSPALPQNE